MLFRGLKSVLIHLLWILKHFNSPLDTWYPLSSCPPEEDSLPLPARHHNESNHLRSSASIMLPSRIRAGRRVGGWARRADKMTPGWSDRRGGRGASRTEATTCPLLAVKICLLRHRNNKPLKLITLWSCKQIYISMHPKMSRRLEGGSIKKVLKWNQWE